MSKQIEMLLTYQEKDSELLAIEQEIASSEERKKYIQTKNFLQKAQEKLDQLEGKSRELLDILERLNKRYEEISDTLKDFDNLDELVDSGADISFYKRRASQLTDSLKSLKAEIAALVASAKDADEEYQPLKKKVKAAQKQYPEYYNEYVEYKNKRKEEANAVAEELKKISKDIDAEVLRRYQTKRSERIFPIICEIKGDRCSKCGMELSIFSKEKVASGQVVECENCHRFLYKKS